MLVCVLTVRAGSATGHHTAAVEHPIVAIVAGTHARFAGSQHVIAHNTPTVTKCSTTYLDAFIRAFVIFSK
jgi:hypothetical protein